MTEPDTEDPAVAERLRRDRPVPSAGFRGTLGRELEARPRRQPRPAWLGLWVLLSGGAGLVLLAVAAADTFA